jgi:hypothetical protein
MKKALLVLPFALTLGACSTFTTVDKGEVGEVPKWLLECKQKGTEGMLWWKEGVQYSCGEGTGDNVDRAMLFAEMSATTAQGRRDKSLASSQVTEVINKDDAIRTAIREQNSPEADVSGYVIDKQDHLLVNGTIHAFVRLKWYK